MGNAPLDLTSGVAYDNLVDQAAVAMGVTATLVVPGDADNSFLVMKVEGTQASVGDAGDVMPPVGSLSGADQATIRNWVNGGANP